MRQITLETLKTIAPKAKGEINKIYLHWTGGTYNSYFDTYHINIDEDGTIMASTDDLTKLLAHTWRRNSNSVGVTLCCGYGAVCYDDWNVYMGQYPPTNHQIETMAKVVAILCKELELPIDNKTVQTHAEVANEDGYGVYDTDPDMRWDLLVLQDYDGDMKKGGDVIRGKALWYQNQQGGI